MVYVSAVVLTLLNLVFWLGILFTLPGTWLGISVNLLYGCERFHLQNARRGS
jgi:hypothetical protein